MSAYLDPEDADRCGSFDRIEASARAEEQADRLQKPLDRLPQACQEALIQYVRTWANWEEVLFEVGLAHPEASCAARWRLASRYADLVERQA